VDRHAPVLAGVALFGLGVEAQRITAIDEVFGAFAGIEPHRVEVARRHRPSQPLERLAGPRGEMGVERSRLGMSENNVSLHRKSGPLLISRFGTETCAEPAGLQPNAPPVRLFLFCSRRCDILPAWQTDPWSSGRNGRPATPSGARS